MPETLLESAQFALDKDMSGLDVDFYAFWDLELLFGRDVLHDMTINIVLN